ncbi:uncharacterized protein EV154DRAFT_488889 [Mucor mucedo]|uniref:uncharacterized protein n=1 Tax=Mucor mucedo TaxID=29922 RepID=UPI0022209F14|nr:uncharacterized protein EV154DRAFT_488889 [Mucor mucedo]KAI7864467.1 hypothetical protein EV154DRAFT_488889 [Mucor mucedo]
MLLFKALSFVLFFNLVICLPEILGVYPADDTFNYTMQSPSGADEMVVSSITEVLKSFVIQHEKIENSRSYTQEFNAMMKDAGSYVVFWLEGLNAETNTTQSSALNNATNVLRYHLPIYGHRERTLCDYYIESFVFCFCVCALSRFVWVLIRRLLKAVSKFVVDAIMSHFNIAAIDNKKKVKIKANEGFL